MKALARIAILSLLVSPAAAQDDEAPKAERKLPDPRKPEEVGFTYDPRELHPGIADSGPVWQRLIGPVGVGGYHVPPARVTGPNMGPPRVIWGQGFGTSLWRDPITGWPLQ